MERPSFEDIKSSEEFSNWYWKKEELIEICKFSALPTNGSKFDLRDRIIYALDNNGKVKPEVKKKKPTSRFKWSKEVLSLNTVITDNVSFGPNFRNFFKKQIGNKFQCHSDFMAWVKSNPGKTLADAILKWEELEKRKEDPNFKREIASHNMYNQYMRDFFEDNPDGTFTNAKYLWDLKKKLPAKNGVVKYESSDKELVNA